MIDMCRYCMMGKNRLDMCVFVDLIYYFIFKLNKYNFRNKNKKQNIKYKVNKFLE